MAIVRACLINSTVKNTGKECDKSMVATAMIIAIHKSVTFDQDDLDDPVTWMQNLIQERKAFPLFGTAAPINEITNDAGQDVIVELSDGLKVFLRYGMYNCMYETTQGGLCYAQALQSFLNSGYSILEIDQQGQMMARDNGDGTFSGIKTSFMFAPSPKKADFKTNPYMNRFQISYSPMEFVANGVVFTGAAALLDMVGLIDVEITEAAAATTTKLKIGVQTHCAEEDLIPDLGTELADPTNFLVTNVATGAAVTITAAAVASGLIELTGTFVSGQIYNVIGTAPSVWYSNDIEGYDGSESAGPGVNITIP